MKKDSKQNYKQIRIPDDTYQIIVSMAKMERTTILNLVYRAVSFYKEEMFKKRSW